MSYLNVIHGNTCDGGYEKMAWKRGWWGYPKLFGVSYYCYAAGEINLSLARFPKHFSPSRFFPCYLNDKNVLQPSPI